MCLVVARRFMRTHARAHHVHTLHAPYMHPTVYSPPQLYPNTNNLHTAYADPTQGSSLDSTTLGPPGGSSLDSTALGPRQASLDSSMPTGSTATSTEGRPQLETWLVMEFCDRGNLYKALQEHVLHDPATGRVHMVWGCCGWVGENMLVWGLCKGGCA